MKKNFLITFIIAIISIIPIYNVRASDITLSDLPDLPVKPVDSYKYYTIVNDNGTVKLFYHRNLMTIDGKENSHFGIYSSGSGGINFAGSTSLNYTFRVDYYKLVDNSWSYVGYGAYGLTIKYSDYVTYEEFDDNPRILIPYIQDKILFTNVNHYVYKSSTKEYILAFSPNDLKKDVPIEYTSEKLKTDDGNLDYYKFHIFTSNYNSEYRYMYKFSDTLAFKDISMYLDDEDGYDIQLYSNDTLYLAVYDLSNNLIYSTTYTVTDLYDNVSTPTADIEVGYTTNENNLSQANIHFKFYNYDTSYKYQYSYNNQDFVDIDYLDIKNKEYTLVKYTNCHIYFRILDLNDNVIFTKDVSVDGILYDNYNKYVLTIDDLYSKETKKIIYHTFYYQNIVDRKNEPMIIFTYEGSQSLNFYLNINEQVTNLKSYMLNLKNNIFTSNISDYTVLPYEYKGNNPLIANYDSYTTFAFLPFLDLDTFVYGTDYTDFRLIIYSNIELNFNSTGNFDGALVPTDGSPILDTNFKTQFKIFSDIFNKAIKRFWTVLVEIIQNVTLFFNSLSPILQDFYIVIFVLVLFIFIMKFIL